MGKTRLFSIAVTFYFGTCIASMKEGSEVNVSLYQQESTNYTPFNAAVNKFFYFNGSELEANQEDACVCENGYCDYEYSYSERRMVCHCQSGYNNFNGYCKKCNCGFGVDGQCEFDSKGETICKCLDGFYEREGRCLPCGCLSSSDINTTCEVTGNVRHCFCKEGFQDVLGYCEDINECETNNTCHTSAMCDNTFGSFECNCPDGYTGYNGRKVKPGEVCEDVNECEKSIIACWYWNNVKCVNLPGSYKCECLQGYKPGRYFDEPQKTKCVQTTKNVGPAVIVVLTTVILMSLTFFVHIRVKKRTTR